MLPFSKSNIYLFVILSIILFYLFIFDFIVVKEV
jgi:hypothetical protein